jgi:hypothetical protein
MVAAKKLFGTFLCNSLWLMALTLGAGRNNAVLRGFQSLAGPKKRPEIFTGCFVQRPDPRERVTN